MDFLLLIVLWLEIFVGYNAQTAGNFNFACGAGEEYDMCRSPCEPTCDSIRRGDSIYCSRPCVPGCYCMKGLVRAEDKTCVMPSECTRHRCEENEVFLECGSPCEYNCSSRNSVMFCAKPCQRGCFCKTNFVRNSKGNCIYPRDCAINFQCRANEIYVNCVNLCNTCYRSESCTTPYCNPGCDCKPGYFKNYYGDCVTEEQCIAEEYALQQQCGVNEEYTYCVKPCNDCVSRGRCDYFDEYCEPGCDCKEGFFRNENGACVPEWNCYRPQQHVCPPSERFYPCIPTCQVTCDTYNDPNVLCDLSCTKGCFCKEGLIRRQDGMCVAPKDCPTRPLPCPPGEVFYQCLPTCGTTCRTLNSATGVCSTDCRAGCFCQPGFVRNDNRICVRLSECALCKTNEEFRSCGSACPTTCENFRQRPVCTERCVSGCFCKAGFVLGPRSNCIRPRNCPVQCKPNEEFRSCGSACPATCENLRQRPVCVERCVPGCFCKTGFVLGPRNNCIRPRNCPVRVTAPEPCCIGIEGRRGGVPNKTDPTSLTTTITTQATTVDSQNKSSSVPASVSVDLTTTGKKELIATTLQSGVETTSLAKTTIPATPLKTSTEVNTIVTNATETSAPKMTTEKAVTIPFIITTVLTTITESGNVTSVTQQ